MVKVHTSKIDEQEQPAKAHKIPRGSDGLPLFGGEPVTIKAKPYNAERNADDGVDYDMSLTDFLAAAEDLTKKKRLSAVFIEVGQSMVPWVYVRSIDRVERWNDDSMRYEFGIILNRDTSAAEGDNVTEWWVNEAARDAAWNSIRDQLVELGIEVVKAKV